MKFELKILFLKNKHQITWSNNLFTCVIYTHGVKIDEDKKKKWLKLLIFL
jgi:hypothetical protein